MDFQIGIDFPLQKLLYMEPEIKPELLGYISQENPFDIFNIAINCKT